MKKSALVIAASLSLFINHVNAQWGNMTPFGSSGSMMPFGGQTYSQPQYTQQPFGGMMPWGQVQQAPVYQAPQQPFGGMMPWGNTTPQYQTPQNNGFGNMMPWGNAAPQYQTPQRNGFGNMMPWGGSQYQQPQTQNFMMPGMEQGLRGMMQPGRIMAEEATPGMYMKPTWR